MAIVSIGGGRQTMARHHQTKDDEEQAEKLADMILGDEDPDWFGEEV